MSKLSNQTKLSPQQHMWLRRMGQAIAVVGMALAGIYMTTNVDDVPSMQHCDTCTEYITDQQGGNLQLDDGDVLCITATGHFNGNLNLRGKNDTIRIVNEGLFQPNNLNFNDGYHLVENHGVFNVNPINYNNADYVRIINYSSGQMQVQTLNLRNEGIFDNAGTFTAHNFNMSGHSVFNNDSSGSVTIRQLQVNDGSSVTNFGQWDITDHSLTLNNGSVWTNGGILNIARDLTVNSSSRLDNTGTIDMLQDFTINSGEIDNQSTIDVERNFTLNGGGNMYHSGTMVIDEDFTVGGTLRGPSNGNYGSIIVDGRSTLYGNSQVEDNIDICDSGQPNNGVDDRWGTPGPNVTYCVHTAGSNPGTFPIELTDFGAKAEGSQVNLWWETASELNNHYFTVERSDGNREFQPIAEIDGAGNSQELLHYDYTDPNPNQGQQYYRLKQTDFDGSATYSSVVEVSVVAPQKLTGRLYPNPAQANTTLALEIPHAQSAIIQVSSMQGQVVQRLTHSFSPGLQEIRLDLGSMGAGLYLVSVLSPDGRVLLPGIKLVKR